MLNYIPPHIDKFKDISNVFAERTTDLIRVRVDGIRAKATIISMDNSPLNLDYTKSKRSESSVIDQELATHLSDTVDYFILWKMKGAGTSRLVETLTWTIYSSEAWSCGAVELGLASFQWRSVLSFCPEKGSKAKYQGGPNSSQN